MGVKSKHWSSDAASAGDKDENNIAAVKKEVVFIVNVWTQSGLDISLWSFSFAMLEWQSFLLWMKPAQAGWAAPTIMFDVLCDGRGSRGWKTWKCSSKIKYRRNCGNEAVFMRLLNFEKTIVVSKTSFFYLQCLQSPAHKTQKIRATTTSSSFVTRTRSNKRHTLQYIPDANHSNNRRVLLQVQ